jgi:hypothetical protein
MSKQILMAALVLLAAAPAAAQQVAPTGAAPAVVADDWKAANKAMGQALTAKDVKGAARWAAVALDRYRRTGAPDKGLLVNLALNVGDTAAETRDLATIRTAATALAAVDTDLAAVDRHGDRTFLLRSLGQLRRATGDRAGWRQALMQVVDVTRAAYGTDHRQVAVALVELSGASQAIEGAARARAELAQAEAIVGKLAADDPVRAVVDLSVATHELEAGRVAEATKRYDALAIRLDPAKPELRPLWWTANGRLANLYAQTGKPVQADQVVARMIARTPVNAEAQPVILLSPDRSRAPGLDPKAAPAADVTFDIAADGKPVNVRAKSDLPQYAALAEAAVRASRYIPVIKDGKPQVTAGQSVTYRETGQQ